jgi:catechol 2,3-dioxygenase-like lactoylglutathione lyase family enzyme
MSATMRLPSRRAPALRLLGIHRVTVICAELERTTAFYRDVLGLALVREGVNELLAALRRWERALERTYRFTGAAVLASGATAIAGVALLGVMVVLPAVLMLGERGRLGAAVRRPRLRPQRAPAS